MKQSFLIPILPVFLLAAPIKSIPSESSDVPFSGEIPSTVGRSRLALASRAYASSAGLALAGTW